MRESVICIELIDIVTDLDLQVRNQPKYNIVINKWNLHVYVCMCQWKMQSLYTVKTTGDTMHLLGMKGLSHW